MGRLGVGVGELIDRQLVRLALEQVLVPSSLSPAVARGVRASGIMLCEAMLQASPDRLARDLDVLARDIGVRLAGTPGERAAADYVIARARAIGADVWDEPFPMRARVVTEEQLEVRVGGSWRRFPARCSATRRAPTASGRAPSSPCWPRPTTSATIWDTCAARP